MAFKKAEQVPKKSTILSTTMQLRKPRSDESMGEWQNGKVETVRAEIPGIAMLSSRKEQFMPQNRDFDYYMVGLLLLFQLKLSI
jgi:hypothetical protein